ncbi:MAG: hypothetical protein ACYTHM_23600, partial [Planctomycetota bacterium]
MEAKAAQPVRKREEPGAMIGFTLVVIIALFVSTAVLSTGFGESPKAWTTHIFTVKKNDFRVALPEGIQWEGEVGTYRLTRNGLPIGKMRAYVPPPTP